MKNEFIENSIKEGNPTKFILNTNEKLILDKNLKLEKILHLKKDQFTCNHEKRLCFSEEKRISISSNITDKRTFFNSTKDIKNKRDNFSKFIEDKDPQKNITYENIGNILSNDITLDYNIKSPEKFNKIPEKLDKIFVIEDTYELENNDFNKSLYDTDFLEKKNTAANFNNKNLNNSNKKKGYKFYNYNNSFQYYKKKNHFNYYNKQKYSFTNKKSINYYCNTNYCNNNYLYSNNNPHNYNNKHYKYNISQNLNYNKIKNNYQENSIELCENNNIYKKRNTWDISFGYEKRQEVFKEINLIQEGISDDRRHFSFEIKNSNNIENENSSKEYKTNDNEIIQTVKGDNKNKLFNKNCIEKNENITNQNDILNKKNIYNEKSYYYNNSNLTNTNNNKKRSNKIYFDNFYLGENNLQHEINFEDYNKQESIKKEIKKKIFENKNLNQEISNEVNESIISIVENININNSFNINIDKENLNLKKIIFKESEDSSTNQNLCDKKIVYFEYENNLTYKNSIINSLNIDKGKII